MENQIEVWKDVIGYEGLYQVSNLGRVKSLNYLHHKGKVSVLKPNNNGLGYLSVMLNKNGKRKKFYLHRLVMLVFNHKSNKQINHKDLNKSNNKLYNLEYVTPKENCQHKMNYFEIIRNNKGRFITIKKK